jgi:AbrB family looped-hinge helix DNA binding protein
MAQATTGGRAKSGVAPASLKSSETNEASLPDVSASVWTKIGDGGRVVIPAEIREQLALQTGSSVLLRVEDGELHLLTSRQAVARAQELARPYKRPGVSVVDELIADRRSENARDEQEAQERGFTRE